MPVYLSSLTSTHFKKEIILRTRLCKLPFFLCHYFYVITYFPTILSVVAAEYCIISLCHNLFNYHIHELFIDCFSASCSARNKLIQQGPALWSNRLAENEGTR